MPADLRKTFAIAHAKIELGESLPEREVLALAKDMIAAAMATVVANNLSPEVFLVAETLLKLKSLIDPESLS